MRRDRHEWVVYFVRHARKQLARRREAALLLGAIAQYPRHFVEVLGEPPQLVAAAHGHLGGQISLGDAGEPVLELGQRPPHAPADEVGHQRHGERAEDEPEDGVSQYLARSRLQGSLPVQQIPARQLARREQALVDDLAETVEGPQPPGRLVPAAEPQQRDLFGERGPHL